MKILKYIYYIINYIIRKDQNMLVFIPHCGCKSDRYNICNYKSDNSLSFLNYLITVFGNQFKYRIAVDYRELDEQKRLIYSTYSHLNIECFPFFNITGNRFNRIKYNCLNVIRVFCRAKYIFSSENVMLPVKNNKQIYTILGYFIPFKNDYNLSYKKHLDIRYKKICDCYITTSLLSSQIISHTYGIPLYKFKILGFSRNDNLIQNIDNNLLDKYIKSSVTYRINKVLLYTPTHRDYEQIGNDTTSRNILGFDVDKERLENYLRTNGIVIICKIHSAQNTLAIKNCLPKGVICFDANVSYGLCELMQYSDALLTDYTSAYFDYLLLDKPVIFNFYDYEKYRNFRGFSFDPINSILAGDIVKDEITFYDALEDVVNNNDNWKEKRIFVKNLVHKYQDKNSSERIYKYIFN